MYCTVGIIEFPHSLCFRCERGSVTLFLACAVGRSGHFVCAGVPASRARYMAAAVANATVNATAVDTEVAVTLACRDLEPMALVHLLFFTKKTS